VESLQIARERHEIDIYAYVIMPEHMHLLVRARSLESNLTRFIHDVKRPVSWRVKRSFQESGKSHWLERLTVARGSRNVFRFWQPDAGFDRNIFNGRGVREVAEYIHGNPVRRGLVESTLDWEYSSARYWAGRRDYLIKMDEIPL